MQLVAQEWVQWRRQTDIVNANYRGRTRRLAQEEEGNKPAVTSSLPPLRPSLAGAIA